MPSTRNHIKVACALKKEARGLRKILPSESVLVTGLGTDRTLRTLEELLENEPPEVLIFTGMAGQLSPGVELGDFVFPETWISQGGVEFHVDGKWVADLRAREWAIRGRGITVRRPVVRQKSRLSLHEKSGALICDMESAAALMICQSYGVVCLAPKLVSDTGDSGMLAFYRNFEKNVAKLGKKIALLERDVRGLLHESSSTSSRR